jgi:aspartyl-tRNA(Asn)/glutamyl-tRNA(Gln) amidotransferase subunit B
VKQSVNYLLTELIRQQYEYGGFDRPRVTAENFAEFITIVNNGTVSSSGAQTLLEEMVKTEGDPSQIVEAKNLAQISDEGQLEAVVNTVIEHNPNSVSDYQNGNTKAIQFLVGQIMKETKGKANPQMARDLLTEKLQV